MPAWLGELSRQAIYQDNYSQFSSSCHMTISDSPRIHYEYAGINEDISGIKPDSPICGGQNPPDSNPPASFPQRANSCH